mmetsp:Transcript_14310/g.38812  ORF Transcript_14310/g.38812 Transcript_14310/m.38812 type:complete len:251 (-) Transcript_14310:519-1271(-)
MLSSTAAFTLAYSLSAASRSSFRFFVRRMGLPKRKYRRPGTEGAMRGGTKDSSTPSTSVFRARGTIFSSSRDCRPRKGFSNSSLASCSMSTLSSAPMEDTGMTTASKRAAMRMNSLWVGQKSSYFSFLRLRPSRTPPGYSSTASPQESSRKKEVGDTGTAPNVRYVLCKSLKVLLLSSPCSCSFFFLLSLSLASSSCIGFTTVSVPLSPPALGEGFSSWANRIGWARPRSKRFCLSASSSTMMFMSRAYS